ncbi:DegT/DnrJ/EryC1/StrS aminotransferase [Desulfobulbus propionicus DSM 2032]|uniref:DegT/DnrJ/EryC1/StrS aminotransferase n=1 Tax=Desulfobulbus propionicus (strain ATCC 33891 / DSM 2032 / VKM B-1956 / 1pr3) TaxID=577650 RepID=A0A7U3YJG8_DESPD|nr:aminotransferase class V-fold PLP-dependent enzyme [Desulfobulbus propionicus]ADW16532.1 DegT/DnrJ/EryC1/StrS aminotransferase [Desulfobulbus propionicus DSM 2032]
MSAQKIYRTFPSINPATVFRKIREENPILDAKRFYLYASGRAALYHGALCLKKIGIHTIYAPEYHCGVEIEALVRAGLIVRFYPIKQDLSSDLVWLESNMVETNCALLVIHYFGFAQPLDQIVQLCKRKKILLIEDCAHALYSSFENNFLGSFGDMAIFSLHKTIPMPNGGGLLINNKEIPTPNPVKIKYDFVLLKITLRSILNYYINAGKIMALFSQSIINLYNKLIYNRDVVIHHIEENQNSSPWYYEVKQYNYKDGIAIISKILLRPQSYKKIIEKRKFNYNKLLRSLNFGPLFLPVFGELPEGCNPLCLPLKVNNSDYWLKKLQNSNLEIFVFGRFCHPLYNRNEIKSNELGRKIICLPIHQQLNQSDMNQLITLINENLRVKDN